MSMTIGRRLLVAALLGGASCTTYTTSPPETEAQTSPTMATVGEEPPPPPSDTPTPALSPPPTATSTPEIPPPKPAPVPAKCNAAKLVPTAEGQPDVEKIGDLDGDGREDVTVAYMMMLPGRGVDGLIIARSTGEADCFTTVYEDSSGRGTSFHQVRPTKSNGWREVAIRLTGDSDSGGMASIMILMTYDGKKYRWSMDRRFTSW